MGKVNCRCGYTISNVCSPSSENGWLVSDIALDLDKIHESSDVITIGVDVWECRDCGSIAFGNHKDNKIRWYRPDEKPTESLMELANPKYIEWNKL